MTTHIVQFHHQSTQPNEPSPTLVACRSRANALNPCKAYEKQLRIATKASSHLDIPVEIRPQTNIQPRLSPRHWEASNPWMSVPISAVHFLFFTWLLLVTAGGKSTMHAVQRSSSQCFLDGVRSRSTASCVAKSEEY